MSLKAFHVFFIVCAIIISLIFGYWSYCQYQLTEATGHLLSTVGSVIVAVGLVLYEIVFLKRVKE